MIISAKPCCVDKKGYSLGSHKLFHSAFKKLTAYSFGLHLRAKGVK